MAYPSHQTHYPFTPSSTTPNHGRQTMEPCRPIELEEALPLPPPPSLPPFGATTTADDGASETSAASSLSDIVNDLPTALKSSLGPLRTIRRSMSIRGWVSYLHEISTADYNNNNNSSSSKTSSLSPSSSSLSLSSTAFMSPYSSTCSSAPSVAAGADEEPIRCGENEIRSNRVGARGTVVAGSEIQLQQQQQNHNQHQQQQQQQMNTGCRRWTHDWTSLARKQASDLRCKRRITSMSELVEYAEPQRPAEIDRFSGVQGKTANHTVFL